MNVRVYQMKPVTWEGMPVDKFGGKTQVLAYCSHLVLVEVFEGFNNSALRGQHNNITTGILGKIIPV